MDIHGEEFGLTRENGLLFRHNPHAHMYFNDFSVPSSKALKELEDIDALSKHVIMKGLNDDDAPNSPSMDPRTPPRDYNTSSEPSLKLEVEEDEDFSFFRKHSTSSTHPSHALSHSVDDLVPQHHTNTRHNNNNNNDFSFLPSFDLRGPSQSKKDHPNTLNNSSLNHNTFAHHIHNDKSNTETAMIPLLNPLSAHPTIINNINNINTINHISNINNINNITNYNTINNSINISININSTHNMDVSKPHEDMPDPTSMMDDKSAIHLINNANSLEFLDDYITTGSNSSSSPDESPLGHDDEDLESGLNDSTASLANALNNSMIPMSSNSNNSMSTSLATGIHRISSAPMPTSHTSPHPPHNRLHHSTGSLLVSSAPNPSSIPISNIDNTGYHSLNNSCNIVLDPSVGMDMESAGIPIVLAPGGTTVIDGVTYNNRGYEVCGSLNKFNKPCQRIGRCPFHHDSSSPKKGTGVTVDTTALNGTTTSPSSAPSSISNGPINPLSNPSATPIERRYLPIKKGPYKSGWKKDEHIRFLKGLQMHGKGSWKEIALIVGTRTPTQIQVHAHRYYLRQQQETKNKRSIHDISLQDLEELEVQHGLVMQNSLSESTGSSSHISPPSPDRSHSGDLSHIFNSPSLSHSHHAPSAQSTPTHQSHQSHQSHHHPMPTQNHHPHLSNSLTNSQSSLHTHSPLSHSDGIPNPTHMASAALSSPPISAPSSPLVPPISSSNFPPLFSGSATASSLSNTLPGLPFSTFPLAPSYNYHSPPAWFSTPTTSSSSSSSSSSYPMSQMSNLNSMTINMSGLGDVDLHPSAEQKLMSPLTASFSHMSDDDYEDELSGAHHSSSAHATHPAHHTHHLHSHPSSPEEEFPSDDD